MRLNFTKGKVIVTILVSLYGLLIIRSFILHQFFEYPSSSDPEKVAEWIIGEHHDPKACFKISGGFIPTMRPSDWNLQSLCVYKVAEKMQDPSVCELLMPSEYGLNCIGNIWGKYIDEKNCHWYKDNSVRCFEGKDLTPHVYDCSEKNIGSSPDECIHRLAFKKKDTNVCLKIKDVTLRSVCTTRIDTWNKYPELHSNIFFNDDIE